MKKLIVGFVFLILLSACTTSNNVSLKIDDVEIKKEFIEYFENSYNTQSGGTVSESVSQKARSQAELYGNVIAIGKRMNLNPDTEYNKRVETVIKNYGSVEEYLKQADVSKELFDFLMYGTSYQTLLLDEFIKTQGITQEDIDDYFKNNYFRAKHLLLLTQDKSGWEKADLKKKIDKIFEEAKSGADFDKLIDKYNEDPGVKNAPDGYVFTYNEMVSEFFDAVSNSEIGEYSVAETTYGYHVIKRLALDDSLELYESLKNDKKTDICQSLIIDKYFKENFWRVKQILLSTKDKSLEEVLRIQEKAESIFEQAANGSDFEKLMGKYNEDENVTSNPYGYVFTYNEMLPEYFEAATTLEFGEYNLVKTTYGFHIIKRLPLDETPEIYITLKNSKLEKIYEIDEVNINDLFIDYIHSKLDEFKIITRDFTSKH